MCCWFCRYSLLAFISLPFTRHSNVLLLLLDENNFQVDGHTHAVRSHSAIPTNSICYCETLNNISNKQTHKQQHDLIDFILLLHFGLYAISSVARLVERERKSGEEGQQVALSHGISWFENLFLGTDTVNQPLNHRNVLTLSVYTHARCPHEHKSNRRSAVAAYQHWWQAPNDVSKRHFCTISNSLNIKCLSCYRSTRAPICFAFASTMCDENRKKRLLNDMWMCASVFRWGSMASPLPTTRHFFYSDKMGFCSPLFPFFFFFFFLSNRILFLVWFDVIE